VTSDLNYSHFCFKQKDINRIMKMLLGQYPAGRDHHHREEMMPNHDVANASLRQKLANSVFFGRFLAGLG
jgi:hypothetical protein